MQDHWLCTLSNEFGITTFFVGREGMGCFEFEHLTETVKLQLNRLIGGNREVQFGIVTTKHVPKLLRAAPMPLICFHKP